MFVAFALVFFRRQVLQIGVHVQSAHEAPEQRNDVINLHASRAVFVHLPSSTVVRPRGNPPIPGSLVFRKISTHPAFVFRSPLRASFRMCVFGFQIPQGGFFAYQSSVFNISLAVVFRNVSLVCRIPRTCAQVVFLSVRRVVCTFRLAQCGVVDQPVIFGNIPSTIWVFFSPLFGASLCGHTFNIVQTIRSTLLFEIACPTNKTLTLSPLPFEKGVVFRLHANFAQCENPRQRGEFAFFKSFRHVRPASFSVPRAAILI